jgi:ABC-type transporter Mla MlaB component
VSSALTCRVRHDDSGVRIVVRGSLTERTRRRVLDAIWKNCGRRGQVVAVDLSGLTYFDSSSLLALVGMERIAEGQVGCHIDITGVETAAMRLTGVDGLALAV